MPSTASHASSTAGTGRVSPETGDFSTPVDNLVDDHRWTALPLARRPCVTLQRASTALVDQVGTTDSGRCVTGRWRDLRWGRDRLIPRCARLSTSCPPHCAHGAADLTCTEAGCPLFHTPDDDDYSFRRSGAPRTGVGCRGVGQWGLNVSPVESCGERRSETLGFGFRDDHARDGRMRRAGPREVQDRP